MKTSEILQSLETKTLLTNKTKDIPQEDCMDSISRCLSWIWKWKFPVALYDSDIYEVRLVDLVPDAAPSNKPGSHA